MGRRRAARRFRGLRLRAIFPLRAAAQVDLVEVLADVARALVRLHAKGHIHRDVKARNVLVRAATHPGWRPSGLRARAARPALNAPRIGSHAPQVSADYRTAKLADFGLARPLVRPAAAERPGGGAAPPADAEDGAMTPRIGPRKYRAPEVEAAKQYGARSSAARPPALRQQHASDCPHGLTRLAARSCPLLLQARPRTCIATA